MQNPVILASSVLALVYSAFAIALGLRMPPSPDAMAENLLAILVLVGGPHLMFWRRVCVNRSTAVKSGFYFALQALSTVPVVWLFAPAFSDPAPYTTGPGSQWYGAALVGLTLLDVLVLLLAVLLIKVLQRLFGRGGKPPAGPGTSALSRTRELPR